MRPLSRPPETERKRWEGLRSVQDAKAAITQIVQSKGAETLREESFAHRWTEQRWADALAAAQDHLCLWCTRSAGGQGSIDHIRPKSTVTRWALEPGNEHARTSAPRGRKLYPNPALRPGYHWRAYDPDNLAFACNRCNQHYKGTLWHVEPWSAGGPHSPPDPNVPETELALDPFDASFDPFHHFFFDEFGSCHGRTRQAKATIAMAGLDMGIVQNERREIFTTLKSDLPGILRDLDARPRLQDVLERLIRLHRDCSWQAPHAAYRRSTLAHLLQVHARTWGLLLQVWVSELGLSPIPEPPADSFIPPVP